MTHTVWIYAKDLQSGDVWLSPSGRSWRITSVSRTMRDTGPVVCALGTQRNGIGQLAADFRLDEEIEVER